MKFDSIIIGGGLAGSTAALHLAQSGQKVALVTAGKSSLLFNPGSLGLLGRDTQGNTLAAPTQGLATLPQDHPLARFTPEQFTALATQAAQLLQHAGIEVQGNPSQNLTSISPLGVKIPTWLSLGGALTLDALMQAATTGQVAIVHIHGFLDFYPRFIAAALAAEKINCRITSLSSSVTTRMRESESEMRAANIARLMHGTALAEFIAELKRSISAKPTAALILPAVFAPHAAQELRQALPCPVFFAPTMGLSVLGLNANNALTAALKAAGVQIFNGHTVTQGIFQGQTLQAVKTDKCDDETLSARHFILASGSFFGRGLAAGPDKVEETIFGLDTYFPPSRAEWFTPNLIRQQPVTNSGVLTTPSFHTLRGGKEITNLFAVGALLAHTNSQLLHCGAGLAMLTALHAAQTILSEKL